jgi:ribosomal protein L16 Arg81 hydroxylase
VKSENESTPNAWSLSELLAPVDEAAFYAEYWEQRPLHIPSRAGMRREAVLTIGDMNNLLSSLVFRADECKVARGGEIVRSSTYVVPPGERVMERTITDYVDTAALLDWFDQGATLVFSQLNQKWLPLQKLKESLERAMSASVVTNVFLSNHDSQGFSVHYDSHDVFVVQLHGSKIWSIYDSPIELPTKREAFGTRNVTPRETPTTVTVHPGDLLYIPRGYFHEARTTEATSLHLTLGVHPYLWIDYLHDVIGQIGSIAAPLRRSAPHGNDPAAERNRIAQLRQILLELAEFEDLPQIANGVYRVGTREKTQRSSGIKPDHLLQILASRDLTPDSKLTCPMEWSSMTLARRQDVLVLRGPWRSISLPIGWEAMLEALRPGRAFIVRELPGDGRAEEKLAFARRLVGLGLLTSDASQIGTSDRVHAPTGMREHRTRATDRVPAVV